MKTVSKLGVDLIKLSEGYRPEPYHDRKGHLTIGYGHKILEEEVFEYLTEDEACDLMMKDIHPIEKYLNLFHPYLNQNQFDALVCFIFNLGETQYRKSTLNKYVKKQEFTKAANEFKKWIYARDVDTGEPEALVALVKRRQREKELFLMPISEKEELNIKHYKATSI